MADIGILILAICLFPFAAYGIYLFSNQGSNKKQLQRIYDQKKIHLEKVLKDYVDEITQLPDLSSKEKWERVFVTFRRLGSSIENVTLNESGNIISVKSIFGIIEIEFST